MKLGERNTKRENQKTKTLKIRQTIWLKILGSWEGPTFVYVICNRYLYRNGLKLFDSSKYDFDTDSVIHKVDIERSWVCWTCDKYLKKEQIPGQTVINKLEISASSDVLIGLNRLERVLISKRILFKKVTIMPKR